MASNVKTAAAAPAPKSRPFPAPEGPGPRCGHTLIAIAGPDGQLNGAKIVLFGGATALEGSNKGDGQPNSPGPSGIRLAGATNEVHVMDVREGKWERIVPAGEPPSPRAAHAAAAVGSMVVIQGGIGPAGLASEDLHVLDFTDPAQPRWHRVFVQGPGPSARYAHTLALVANRFLVALGGNDGKRTLSDAWALDTSEKPYRWRKITDAGEAPPPRMYATAAARSDGLLLLSGGRAASGSPLNDAYGLARHRDGRWEWAVAPGLMPAARYQHAAVFVGARLHVSGGSVGGGRMVDDAHSVVVLDTAAGVWVADGDTRPPSSGGGEPGPNDVTRRCRHAAAAIGPYVFVYGGLRGSHLLSDLLLADDQDGHHAPALGICDPRSPAWRSWLDAAPGGNAASMLADAAAAEAAAAAAIGVRRSAAMGDLLSMEDGADRPMADSPKGTSGASTGTGETAIRSPDGRDDPSGGAVTPDVRLYHRAVVVAHEKTGSLRGLVRQLSIDQFEHENRRVAMPSPLGGRVGLSGDDDGGVFDRGGGAGVPPGTPGDRPLSPLAGGGPSAATAAGGVQQRVIAELLRPRQWTTPEERNFFLDFEEINQLCDAAESILRKEGSVLALRAPIKIFGDLHGQFGDLMRLFEEYGTPSTAGDITYIDYLFLGDFVDRGAHSLETICLLLALKIEHPRSVHLIRGNHEAADINALFGFRQECMDRLSDPEGIYVWTRLNSLFNWLPLAATIEGKVLCCHGGIGRSIRSVSQIDAIKRPCTMEDGGVVLMDLLWSDPTTNDGVEGVQPSPRGPGLVTFGPDRVLEFCAENDLQMIVRAHECVMDGFERFAQGHLITLFSATNYCGTAGNAGAILVLGRDLVMVPKLIHPLPPSSGGDLDEDGGPYMNDTWMQAVNEERPPTPPRGRPNSTNSLEVF